MCIRVRVCVWLCVSASLCMDGLTARLVERLGIVAPHPHLHFPLSHHFWKKPSLVKEYLANYRPISNLSTISIITERVETHHLNHLSSNTLLNPYQSAYSKNHSTKTTLLSLHDHLSNAIAHQQVSCLCLLDLSAAFDTLDHSILLTRLSTYSVSPPSPSAGSALIFHPAHLLCL